MKDYILRNKLNFAVFTTMMIGGYFVISDFNVGLLGAGIFWIVWAIINLTCITPELLILKPMQISEEEPLPYSHMLEIIGHLSDTSVGSSKEQSHVHEIANKIEALLEEKEIGGYDGDEFGDGKVSLFYFSNSPEELLSFIRPLILQYSMFKSFSYTITEL